MTDSTPRVTLREVTKETVRTIIDLDVGEHQQNFVAPNSVSIAPIAGPGGKRHEFVSRAST